MMIMNPNPPTDSTQGLGLEVRDLRKSFGTQTVLNGVSFQVKPGEIFVVMGPSGSGKSVLLRHLMGLEPADAGEILINGQDIEDSPRDANGRRLHRIAMVFQSGALLNSLNLAENVGLYLREHRLKSEKEIHEVVSEKLKLVGLEGAEDKLPSELSGGMRKRAAIARALVMDPQLILYDEPTSELDPLSAKVISQEIQELNRRIGATSVVVSHDRDMAFRIADRIAILYQGDIVALGGPEEVKKCDHPVIQEFLNA
jgi:phospholipid/cholesterol/gamma-HCH transport system ATP-binding protein